MSSSIKIWVQPVGGVWNIRYINDILFRTRTKEDAIEEAKLFLKDIIKKYPDEEMVEIIIETEEGYIKSIKLNKNEL